MISLTAWKGKRTEDDGNWKARGGPAGLQHPAAKSSDKSRGNLAGSRGKCGLTTQHGTGGQKVLCDSKKNPRDSHAGDIGMLPSSNGTLVPEAIVQTTGGLGGQQHQPGSWCRLTWRQQATILVKVAENGKTRPKKI